MINLVPQVLQVYCLFLVVFTVLGVELMGVDMVVAPDGQLLVVDVNHFSGAPSSVPGFEAALARTVTRVAGAEG